MAKFKTKEEIEEWFEKVEMGRYTINDDLTVDVISSFVDISMMGLTEIPVQFGKVGKDFHCSGNQLTTLQGCPEYVGGDFKCNRNELTSLKGGPKEVGGTYDCSSTKLVSLKGSPEKVGGNFDCNGNDLTSLEGSPKEVGGDFHCAFNQITSFEGCPEKVGGKFMGVLNNLENETIYEMTHEEVIKYYSDLKLATK